MIQYYYILTILIIIHYYSILLFCPTNIIQWYKCILFWLMINDSVDDMQCDDVEEMINDDYYWYDNVLKANVILYQWYLRIVI